MQTLWQDLRYGLRMLAKSPGFTLVAVLALTLGVGANTAIFSVVNAVLLRPLPYAEPDRLLMVWEARPARGIAQIESSPAEVIRWREEARSFEGVVAIDTAQYNLTGGAEPVRVSGARVSAGLLGLLGVRPALGRDLLPEEDAPGRDGVVLLSHELWQTRFGSDPGVVGQTITLSGTPCVVAGVLPRGFDLLGGAQVVRPIAFRPDDRDNSGSHFLNVVARLRAGVSQEEAAAELEAIAGRLEQEFPETNAGHHTSLVPLREQIVGGVRPALLVLLGAVGCVLLIACANVANLLLARAASRRRELAVRAAMGASRWRIVRQLLTESLTLSLAGGACGLLLAWWGIDLLVGLAPGAVPRADEIALDRSVLLFTLGVSTLTGLAFGLAPALRASRTDLSASLKDGDRGSTEGGAQNRLRSALVVAEVALSLVLLAGAGLLVKSFVRVRGVDPGFDARGVLALDLTLPQSKYREPERATNFYRELLERTAALPGVRAAGAVSVLPLSGNDTSSFITTEDAPDQPRSERLRAGRRVVSPEYFCAMGVPLRAGRALAPTDTDAGVPVAVVNETFARQVFRGADPLGRRVRTGDNGPWLTVVGVAGDVRHTGLEADARPELFVPFTQSPARQLTLAVRADGDPSALASAIRAQVRELDPEQPVGNVTTLEELVSASTGPRRFAMTLLAVFAGVAVLLAVVGIYGVMSYTVARRTHEIGVRLALGAQGRDVLRLVIGQGMRPALAGVGLGLVAAALLTRLMTGLLYGVSATDPLTFSSVAALLAAAALAACFIPARRATRVDPMEALRYE